MLIDLSGLQRLRRRSRPADGGTRAGRRRDARRAGRAIPSIAARLPALAEAARAAAGPGHRSAATLGGNLCQDTRCVFYNQSEWWRASNDYCLKRGGDTCHVAPQGERCHAAFSGDLAPVLLALGAEVELQSARGTRWLPLAQLYRDDGAAHLTLARGRTAGARSRAGAARAAASAAIARRGCASAMDFPLAAVAVALVAAAGPHRVAGDRPVGHQLPSAAAGRHARSWSARPVDDDAARPRRQAGAASRSARCAAPSRRRTTGARWRPR